jgi:hypothetical protein
MNEPKGGDGEEVAFLAGVVRLNDVDGARHKAPELEIADFVGRGAHALEAEDFVVGF